MKNSYIIKKMIELYAKSIKELPQNDYLAYCHDNKIENGICSTAAHHLNLNMMKVSRLSWVKSNKLLVTSKNFSEYSAYWAKPPRCASSFEECKKLLQIRLRILRKELRLI